MKVRVVIQIQMPQYGKLISRSKNWYMASIPHREDHLNIPNTEFAIRVNSIDWELYQESPQSDDIIATIFSFTAEENLIKQLEDTNWKIIEEIPD